MDRDELIKIENELAALPKLQKQQEEIKAKINEMEIHSSILSREYVDKNAIKKSITKDPFYFITMKIRGKYKEKIRVLTENIENIKLEHIKTNDNLISLKSELEDLNKSIQTLERKKNLYDEELKKREVLLGKGKSNEMSKQYGHLKEEHNLLLLQISEIKKVAGITEKLINTIQRALDNFTKGRKGVAVRLHGRRNKVKPLDIPTPDRKYLYAISVHIKELIRLIEGMKNFDNSPYNGIIRSVIEQLNKIGTPCNEREYVRNLRRQIECQVQIWEELKTKISEQLCYVEKDMQGLLISL